MIKPKNPHWGNWGINWDDSREAAEALGTSYFAGRYVNREMTDDDLPFGFHVEDIALDQWDSEE